VTEAFILGEYRRLMEDKRMIKIATIGTSKITESFISIVDNCGDCEIEAIYSREENHAREFAKKHHINQFYCDLKQVASNPCIDAVYIASPNSIHYEQAIYMMKAGKHVLCEKTLGSNKMETRQMFEISKENQVVLLEAMRTVHDEAFKKIKDNIYKLGNVRKATLEFCQYSSRYDDFLNGKDVNIFKRELSAGALMDLGVYCVQAMVALFGKPNCVTAFPILLKTSVDGAGAILAKYDGMISELSYSKITDSENYSQIQGEEGTMYIEKIQNPKKVFIIYRDGSRENIEIPQSENNMIYELQSFVKAIKQDSNISYFQDISLNTAEVLDMVKNQIGLVFPADKKRILG
jgi:predicted dehydrogenase